MALDFLTALQDKNLIKSFKLLGKDQFQPRIQQSEWKTLNKMRQKNKNIF